MFGALTPGFRNLATLKPVENVDGETEKNSCDISRFPCDSMTFMFVLMGYADFRSDAISFNWDYALACRLF